MRPFAILSKCCGVRRPHTRKIGPFLLPPRWRHLPPMMHQLFYFHDRDVYAPSVDIFSRWMRNNLFLTGGRCPRMGHIHHDHHESRKADASSSASYTDRPFHYHSRDDFLEGALLVVLILFFSQHGAFLGLIHGTVAGNPLPSGSGVGEIDFSRQWISDRSFFICPPCLCGPTPAQIAAAPADYLYERRCGWGACSRSRYYPASRRPCPTSIRMRRNRMPGMRSQRRPASPRTTTTPPPRPRKQSRPATVRSFIPRNPVVWQNCGRRGRAVVLEGRGSCIIIMLLMFSSTLCVCSFRPIRGSFPAQVLLNGFVKIVLPIDVSARNR